MLTQVCLPVVLGHSPTINTMRVQPRNTMNTSVLATRTNAAARAVAMAAATALTNQFLEIRVRTWTVASYVVQP